MDINQLNYKFYLENVKTQFPELFSSAFEHDGIFVPFAKYKVDAADDVKLSNLVYLGCTQIFYHFGNCDTGKLISLNRHKSVFSTLIDKFPIVPNKTLEAWSSHICQLKLNYW